jgi:hypothetical protein
MDTNKMDANKNPDVYLREVMKDIENKATSETYKVLSSKSSNSNNLIEIVNKGSDEFKQKTGRNMSYFEMRQMFG